MEYYKFTQSNNNSKIYIGTKIKKPQRLNKKNYYLKTIIDLNENSLKYALYDKPEKLYDINYGGLKLELSNNDKTNLKNEINKPYPSILHYIDDNLSMAYTAISYIKLDEKILIINKFNFLDISSILKMNEPRFEEKLKKNTKNIDFETLSKIKPYNKTPISISNKRLDINDVKITIEKNKWKITKKNKTNDTAQILFESIEKYNNTDIYQILPYNDATIFQIFIEKNKIDKNGVLIANNLYFELEKNKNIKDCITVKINKKTQLTETKTSMVSILSNITVIDKYNNVINHGDYIKHKDTIFTIISKQNKLYINKL